MNCHYCNGLDTVEEQIATFSACDIPQAFIVENVPAFVCYLCGDKSFSSETIKAMDKIRFGKAKASESRIIRVFDFCQLENGLEFSSDEDILHATSHQTLNENQPALPKPVAKTLMAYP